MDLQAQDRAHRIGQTRPVVISQGKFGRVVDENGRVLLGRSKLKGESAAEMAKAMLDLEGEEINIASADDTIIR
jgi:ATP-dependent DNA helicase